MANPAHLLHQQLLKWNQQKLPAVQARNEPPANEWAEHRLMVKHLEAIDELLNVLTNRGKNMSVYRNTFTSWCDAVFAYPNGWTPANSGAIDPTSLNHLETLATWLEDEVPPASEERMAELVRSLAEIRALLGEDDSLPLEFKGHFGQIMDHLVWCVDNYQTVGDFELREATERLLAAMAQACTKSEKMRERWTSVLNNFVWPFTTNMMAAIPAQLLIQQALGS